MALQGSPSSLEVSRSPVGASAASPRAVVWVRGEHDIATRSELSNTFARVIARGAGDLVVDLSLVEFMDASTVGVIVGARNLLRERSEELTVHAPSRFARRVLDICGLAGLIDAEEPESETRASALSTWVQVPAADRGDVGFPPEPGASHVQTPRPPPVHSRPRS